MSTQAPCAALTPRQPILNDSEVKVLFSHPLAAFLSEEPPAPLPAASEADAGLDPLAHPERVRDPPAESSLIAELTADTRASALCVRKYS